LAIEIAIADMGFRAAYDTFFVAHPVLRVAARMDPSSRHGGAVLRLHDEILS
ncbi:hypothetical protein OY671_007687, partial [Metschnikowia pulcherrima]